MWSSMGIRSLVSWIGSLKKCIGAGRIMICISPRRINAIIAHNNTRECYRMFSDCDLCILFKVPTHISVSVICLHVDSIIMIACFLPTQLSFI